MPERQSASGHIVSGGNLLQGQIGSHRAQGGMINPTRYIWPIEIQSGVPPGLPGAPYYASMPALGTYHIPLYLTQFGAVPAAHDAGEMPFTRSMDNLTLTIEPGAGGPYLLGGTLANGSGAPGVWGFSWVGQGNHGVTATGYWKKNGVVLPGGTGAMIGVTNVFQYAKWGWYNPGVVNLAPGDEITFDISIDAGAPVSPVAYFISLQITYQGPFPALS